MQKRRTRKGKNNKGFPSESILAVGFGICILPSLTLERIHGDVNTYAIEPMEYREFGIAVLNSQMMAPAVRQMAMFIESFARRKRTEDPATNAGFDPENVF